MSRTTSGTIPARLHARPLTSDGPLQDRWNTNGVSLAHSTQKGESMPREYATAKRLYEVWYRRDPLFRSDPHLTAANLENTHAYIGFVEQESSLPQDHTSLLGYVYQVMQGEIWSSWGQAKHLLARRGVHHTSMSVGDVVVTPSGLAFEVDDLGFREIGHLGSVGALR